MTNRAHRIAVVGAGPAGFYATGHLLDAEPEIEVDLYDRLPTPWGLVRHGVAPDHPKIKAVSRVFEKIADKPGFRMFGNVEIGRDVSHAQLMEHYDGVIYAYGAQADRRMGIPGEDLPGSLPATAFVAWYNGHPDFYDLDPNLQIERAVVIGNGNVAVDVARMMALAPEELAPTDTGDHAIEIFNASTLQDIVIAGRRGPLQAAYTNPELLELGELQIADVIVRPEDAQLDPISQAALADASQPDQRNVEVVQEYAQRARTDKPRTVTLRYLLSPLEIRGDGRVEEIVMVKNRLELSGDGTVRAVATDGHRLARYELELPDGAGDMPGVIVPRKTVGELVKLLDDADGAIDISLSDTKIQFGFNGVELTSKLIDGNFPPYERVIPSGNDKSLALEAREFAQSVDRVSTISADKTRAVKLNLSKDKVTLSVVNPESGTATEDVGATYSAGALEVGFNARYLLDITSQIEGKEVRFLLSDAGSPAIIEDAEDPRTLYVLMPLRV